MRQHGLVEFGVFCGTGVLDDPLQFQTVGSLQVRCYNMNRKADCRDNAVIESFFHTLKIECADEKRCSSRDGHS